MVATAVIVSYLMLARQVVQTHWPVTVPMGLLPVALLVFPVILCIVIGLVAQAGQGRVARVARPYVRAALRRVLDLPPRQERLLEFGLETPAGQTLVVQMWSQAGALRPGNVVAVAGRRDDEAGTPRVRAHTVYLRDGAQYLLAGTLYGWRPNGT